MCKKSKIDANPPRPPKKPFAEKSFYSLEYTGQDFSDQDDVNDDTMTTFEDYTKIIEELQSHRREIEKLQTDFASPTSDERQGGGNDHADAAPGVSFRPSPSSVASGTLTNSKARHKSTQMSGAC